MKVFFFFFFSFFFLCFFKIGGIGDILGNGMARLLRSDSTNYEYLENNYISSLKNFGIEISRDYLTMIAIYELIHMIKNGNDVGLRKKQLLFLINKK